QVACNGKGIDKADGNNDYTYSQRKPSTLDVLVQGFDSQKNHPVDDFIDVHEDKTTVLQEKVNVSLFLLGFTHDYKPCLASVFANVKAKRKKCGIERNYLLSYVKERKKRLAMALDSLFGQQSTTTPALPKTLSRSVNGDFIMPPEFLEDVSGEPKIRSINELMTLEVFAEQLSRPHNCIRDKVTIPNGFFDFIKMQDL
nr:hypothetical protein [Tanacetum cinerariifolium]